MRLLVLSAAIAAVVLGALPASAEVVVRAGDAAVVVGQKHDSNWRHHHADCRDVRVRTRLPNGRFVMRVRHTCN
jgi:hypothetical protein